MRFWPWRKKRAPEQEHHVAEQPVFPLEHNDTGVLLNVHSANACAGEHCTVHNRSDHSMRAFPQHWRSDRGIMERICPHGVGHPDPDSPWDEGSHEWVHGCDGCCAPK